MWGEQLFIKSLQAQRPNEAEVDYSKPHYTQRYKVMILVSSIHSLYNPCFEMQNLCRYTSSLHYFTHFLSISDIKAQTFTVSVQPK